MKYCRDCSHFARDSRYSFGLCDITGKRHEGDDYQCTEAFAEPIKACPFCGATPIEKDNFGNVDLFVTSCENPGCKIHPHRVGKTREECTRDWNTRV